MISICSNSSSSGDEKDDSEILHEIRQEYLQAKPPLQIKGLLQLLQLQEKDCNKDMKNRIIALSQLTVGQTKHQPPVQYRITFVKHVIKQLESAIADKTKKDEEDEDVSMWYDALESFSSLGYHSEPFYRLYDIGNDGKSVVKIFENEAAFVAEGTTGLITWEASIELAKWLNSPNRKIDNPRWILELGCGCGFLGVAALQIFPHLSRYIASDGHSSAVQKAELNLKANFGSSKSDVIQTELIHWQKDEDKFQTVVINLTEMLGPGILLGADIVFDPGLIPPLVKLIDIFLGTSQSSTAYLSCTIRNESTIEVLKNHLETDPNRSVTPKHEWKNGVIYEIKS